MIPLLLASAVALAPPQLPPTPIADAIARQPNGALRLEGHELRLNGVATASSNMYFRDVQKVFIQDDRAGIALFTRKAKVDIAEGDRIEAVGRLGAYSGETELQVDYLHVLRHGPPPAPIEVPAVELLSRRYAGRLVRTEATVASTAELSRGINIVLRAGSGALVAHLTADQARVLPKNLAVNTTVRITGVSSEYTRDGQTTWEILPRAYTDVVLIERGPRISAEQAWTITVAVAAIAALVFAWIVSLRRKVQRAVAEYRALDERYRFLFEDNPIPMWVCDAKSKRILTINRAAVTKYGFTAEEFRAMSFADLGVAESRRVGQQRTKSGRSVFVEVLSSPIVYAGREALVFIAVDVTEWASPDAQARSAAAT